MFECIILLNRPRKASVGEGAETKGEGMRYLDKGVDAERHWRGRQRERGSCYKVSGNGDNGRKHWGSIEVRCVEGSESWRTKRQWWEEVLRGTWNLKH